MCDICQEIITIPVVFPTNCICNYKICISCANDYIKHHNVCMMCKQKFHYPTYSLPRINELNYLDREKGNIKCNVCNWTGTRVEFITRHKHHVPFFIKEIYPKIQIHYVDLNINRSNLRAKEFADGIAGGIVLGTIMFAITYRFMSK